MNPTLLAPDAAVSGPTLVLMPGLDGTGRMFQPFLARRSPQQVVTVIDYPSHRPATYDELLELVWSRLPGQGSFVLLGESFSGPLAVRVAARRPSGLAGVILCASFVRSPTPWYIRWWHSLFTPTVVRGLIALESMAMQTLVGRCKDELRQLVREARREVRADILASRVRATLTVDVTEELKQVAVPILYLAGRWDVVVPERCRTLIQRLRPDVEFQTIPAPHAVLQTRPTEAWAAINDWSVRLPGAVPSAHAAS